MTPDALASVSPLPAVVQTNELATVRFAPVIAGYPNLAIQWRSNGVAIAGATSAVFTTPVLTYPAFTNVVYDVVVSSLYNTVTSTPAMIELVLDTV
ncbi:MAG: hypothetical protein Q7U75_08400, partial [Desulfobacterales bacterium]|nr:hypothetical protein [Desulfobacterales bacterium]